MGDREALPTIRRRPSDSTPGVVRHLRSDDEFDASEFPAWMDVAVRIAFALAVVGLAADGIYQIVLAAIRNRWFV